MKRNLLVLMTTFVFSLLGVFMPQGAEPLALVPTISMMVQLLYCFLSTSDPSTPVPFGFLKSLPKFLGFKMFVAPLLCWAVVRAVYPEYALGALLVAGASIGVSAPFFAFLCGAEPFFVVGSVIASSLVLPFSIPLLTAVVLSFDGRSITGLMEACLGSAFFLGYSMLLPFATARLLWKKFPGVTGGLMSRRFGITLFWIAAGNYVIFSRFSGPLRNNPAAIADAALVCVLTTAVILGLGVFAARKQPPDQALSRIIGVSCVNCGLMVIVAAEFFSLSEVLVCAVHTVMLMSMGVPYEICRRWLMRRTLAVL